MNRGKKVFLFLFLLFVGAGGAAVAYVYTLFIAPYKGYAEPKIAVTIPEGSSLNWIMTNLYQKGVIRHPWLLYAIFLYNRTQEQSKAGDYVFDRPLTPFEVYQKLLKGEMFYTVVTIPEGSSLFEIEFILNSRKICSPEQFRQIIVSQTTLAGLKSIDATITSAEGFLFPETYFLGKRDGVQELVLMMLKEFQKHLGPAEKQRAQELGMTVLQIMTLASLIEEETGEDSERPLVSAVFHNRLKKSMLLQCDPTVIYVMKMSNEYKGRLLRKDLERDSQYNTYRYPGLPPGPICNPGLESIKAALYPQQSEMLYFVSKNDGTHYFSATLQDHNQAVQRYRRSN
jgi:UPF0755 protein